MDILEEFRAGVTACLRSWSALSTAVDSGWGGGVRESQAKADELRRTIFEMMDGSKCPPPNFDILDLADNLAIYIEEEFSVTLEDGSERQVAEVLFKMYEGCCNGDPTLARQMVAHAEGAVAYNSQFPVQLQSSELDDDDEDMIDSQNVPQNVPQLAVNPLAPSMIPADYNANSLFGPAKKAPVPTGPSRQLGVAAPEKPADEMDDDGFAAVKPKTKRRN